MVSKRLQIMSAALLAAWLAAGVQAQEPAVYAVDASRSEVYWRVYRAGTFSRFGHNHVVSAGELTGTVTRGRDIEGSTFELEIPVAGLVVDDPAIRARHGEDFSSEPSSDDIAGTRRNMLGERVLDAENHPVLRLRGTLVSGSLDAATLDATVEILGRSVSVSIPASIVADGDTLTASGEFRLDHADLGMEPFNVMMGALAVGEPLDFTYRITAEKAAGAGGSEAATAGGPAPAGGRARAQAPAAAAGRARPDGAVPAAGPAPAESPAAASVAAP